MLLESFAPWLQVHRAVVAIARAGFSVALCARIARDLHVVGASGPDLDGELPHRTVLVDRAAGKPRALVLVCGLLTRRRVERQRVLGGTEARCQILVGQDEVLGVVLIVRRRRETSAEHDRRARGCGDDPAGAHRSTVSHRVRSVAASLSRTAQPDISTVAGRRRPSRAAENWSQITATSATHTKPKPISRSGGIGSPYTAHPRSTLITGTIRFSGPSSVNGTDWAAPAKSINGTAVTMPVPRTNSQSRVVAAVGMLSPPPANMIAMITAGTNETKVSPARLSTAPNGD